jgi:hypothetical protein
LGRQSDSTCEKLMMVLSASAFFIRLDRVCSSRESKIKNFGIQLFQQDPRVQFAKR